MPGKPARTVTDDERRFRLARRHGLVSPARFGDITSATTALTAWHATELSSIHLAIGARVDGVQAGDVETQLNVTRTLVKQLGMRRTLFAVDRGLLPAVIAGPGHRVAGPERRRLAKEVAAGGLTTDGDTWVAAAEAAVLAALDGGVLTTAEVKQRVPAVAGTVPVAIGTKWGQHVPLAPRVLTILAADGQVARAANATHWRTSRPTWTTMSGWLGAAPDLPDARTAYRDLVRRWLWSFGPGTEEDIVWWLGATKTAVRAALADVGAVAVGLESGATGWLLPDDLGPVAAPGEWVALLPSLDPTTMGWRDRDFYLDPADTAYLFDSVGNAVPTIWANGRIAGGWIQDDDNRVRLIWRAEPSRSTQRLAATERDRLETFLEGVRVPMTYAKAMGRGDRLP